jgi:hypothetical protein
MTSGTLSLGQIPSAAPYSADSKPYAWIVHPVFDWLFVFGGLVWLVLIMQYFSFGWSEPGTTGQHPHQVQFLLALTFVGGFLFADAHTAATYMRLYENKESRRQFHFYAKILPFFSLALFACALAKPAVAGAAVYVHAMWVYQHYTAQSFGMAMIYCYKRNFKLSKLENSVFRWFMLFLAFTVISRTLTQREFSPESIWTVPVPFWNLPIELYYVSVVGFIVLTVAFLFLMVRKFHVEKAAIPLPATLMVVLTAVIGLSTGYANAFFWTYGPQFFHGSQYVAVSLAYHLKERHLVKGVKSSDIAALFLTKDAFRWLAIAVSAGIFIYIGVPKFFEAFGFGFVAVSTTMTACINFHHFLSDAAIWRLRDPNCRKILVS